MLEPDVQNPVAFLPAESVSRSAEETFELAARIGAHLVAPAILLLSGELGAGKTVFAKGLAAGLGIDPDEVTSPTFTLINEYEGRARLYHVDLYRLEPGACDHLGLDEIFADPQAITVIEWAERLGERPEGAIQVVIEVVSGVERRVRIEA